MFANYIFLLSDKLLRMVFGLTTNLLLVAYLSPTDLGTWNYVLAVATIAGAISIFSGIDVIIIRDLAQATPPERGRIIGSVIILRLLTGLLATAGSIVFAIWMGEPQTIKLILIVALSYIVQIFHTLDYFFQSQLIPKFSALLLNVTTTIGFIAKMTMMSQGVLNIELLCWILTIESFLLSAGYLWIVSSQFQDVAPRSWHVDKTLVQQYMNTGLALLASGLVSVLIARVSVFQIDVNFDRAGVAVFGLYALIFEAILMVNYTLANAYFPIIIKKHANPDIYAQELCSLARRQTYLWIIISGSISTVIIIGHKLFGSLINPIYRQSLEMILIGIPATALFIINFYLLQFFIIPHGNARHQLARALLGLCVLIASNTLLFRTYSIESVVASITLSQLSILTFTIIKFRKKLYIFFKIQRVIA